jgi:manganese-dependent inorganic pyrophosphatase
MTYVEDTDSSSLFGAGLPGVFFMQTVYVIGHRLPDTDSLASAVGYSALLNLTGESGKFIPAVAGPLNAESEYALSRFGVPAPVIIESVEPTVADIPFLYPHRASRDMPAIDVATMMDEQDIRNIPIIGQEDELLGLVSEHGLAKAFVTPNRVHTLKIGPIPPATLARILDATVWNEASPCIDGPVVIVIDALHVALSRLTPRDVVVMGDNEPSQLALISAGIAALIIAEGAPVGTRVLDAARVRGVSIIASPLDAFSVGRMVLLSVPAERVMATDMPVLRPEDPLEYAKRVVTNSRYRSACVVDGGGRLLGMISRNTFLHEVQKAVVLVDHNEFSQAVDGIERADILEVIDHHRLGAISTLNPVKFLNEPVGSTSTIIARKFREAGIAPTPAIAGLLLCGVLSDTMVLRMSTTTQEDRDNVEYLAGIAGVEPIELGTTLVQHGMDPGDCPPVDLIPRDSKRYTLFGHEVTIAQVMVASDDYALTRVDSIRNALENLRVRDGVALYLVLFSNGIENGSLIFAAAKPGVLAALGYDRQPLRLDGVMSRKKTFSRYLGRD